VGKGKYCASLLRRARPDPELAARFHDATQRLKYLYTKQNPWKPEPNSPPPLGNALSARMSHEILGALYHESKIIAEA